MSLRDDILKAHHDARKPEPLFIPEWGTTIYITEPTAGRADQLVAMQAKAREVNTASAVSGFRARVAIMVLTDDAGHALFTAADEKALQDGSTAALDRVFKAAKKWLGMDEAVEEEVKNLQGTEGDASSSVSL